MLSTTHDNASVSHHATKDKHTSMQPDSAWNDTASDFPHTTLDTLFTTQAQKTPLAPALVFGDEYLTYEALDLASNQLAHFIREHYITQYGAFKQDTPIALFLNRSFEMLIGILGILKAGGAYVPIDPKYPVERIEYILEDTETKLILTEHVVRSLLPTENTVISLDEKPYASYPSHPVERQHEPHHLAYILYTSGTTGKPKGVAIPHRGIVNRLDWMQRTYPLTTEDVVLQKTPYCFDVSVWELLWAHQVGATLVLAKPDGHQDPLYLQTLILEKNITTLHFVPSMLTVFTQALADVNKQAPQSMRYVFCSGEALTKAQVDAFYDIAPHDVEVHNLYGPTEASIDVTYFACTRKADKVYIGKPIQNTQIYILDSNMNPCEINEAGELYIGGVGLARGYWNKPELTADRFVHNPFFKPLDASMSPVLYKTGDLAKWTPQGDIEYLGRNDFQIKIRGFRIELGEIEHILTQFPGIHQSIVVAQDQHTRAGKNTYLVGYYTSDHPIVTDSIISFLQSHLPEYMIPSALIALPTFPLTNNGKLDRSLLPKHDFAKSSLFEKPRTPLEEQLSSIWSVALDIEHIGITDHFFSLGGHSLIAARILSMIKNTLHKTVSFADFYRSGTILHLASLLDTLPCETNELVKSEPPQLKKLPLADFQLMLWLSHIFEPKAKKMNILMRKRLQGHLNIETLYQAFHTLFEKHEALCYRISKILPTQKSQQRLSFAIERIQNIEHEPLPEEVLTTSFSELLELYPWPKQYPFVLARVFFLANKQSEIQLCMPHLIADERSMEILCEELSEGYLACQTPHHESSPAHASLSSFRYYLHEEQQISNQHAESKIQFWENYLQDARLLVLPKQHIVSSMRKQKLSYSTYVEIPEKAITQLKAFCTRQRVTINDAVTSALAKALAEHQPHDTTNKTQPLLINLIKSTRETVEYDKTIGCFVRVDPLKVDVHKDSDLATLSKQIHNNMLSIADHQRFSSLLKFACFMNCFEKKSWIKAGVTRFFMPVYIKLIQLFQVQYESYKMFQLCWRLASFKRKNLFIINLNLWNNFVSDSKEPILFGMPVLPCPMSQYELLSIDFIFDVCFMRDDASKKPYLVISCNLTPELKTSIAKRTIDLMLQEMAYE